MEQVVLWRTLRAQVEPHSPKAGNFGMKAHVGVDSKRKIIYSAVVKPANIGDSAVLPDRCTAKKRRSGA